MKDSDAQVWFLLIHQIPPKPSYFRAKIWRRLQQVGAVAIKQSVYALPKNEQTYEDMTWILKEIIEGGGEALLSEAFFLEGLSNEQFKARFQTARDADYEQIIQQAQSLREELSQKNTESSASISKIKAQLSRLQRRFEGVTSIDFFEASGRGAAEGVLTDIESRIKGIRHEIPMPPKSVQEVRGKTWVTRKGIYVDRIACAWLIKRFINHNARFKFSTDKKYRPKKDEVRFDMSEAEFTHEGDRCTFEVMIERFRLDDPALIKIAEIIHDIDLKDGKFARQETAGINALFSGLSMAHQKDEERLERGSVILYELYEYFSG